MKYLLLVVIKIYWLLIPKRKRNKCLFAESCSNYVFKITKNNGLLRGYKALLYRMKNCRPEYQIINIENKTYIISANHEIFPMCDIRDSILKLKNNAI